MQQGAAAGGGRRSRSRLATDLAVLGVIGALLIAAFVAAGATLYREFYSPAAFVERYLGLLADGHAAEALATPGVSVDIEALEAAGLPPTASQALLRRDALAALGGVEIVGEETDRSVTRVTAAYRAGQFEGTTTFEVERDGSVGPLPTWRFATSPLAVMQVAVQGSMTFDVNGFSLDKRQVSPDGAEADPSAPVSLLVFSPGIYSVSVDTAISTTPGVAVVSDSPFSSVPVSLQAQPTEEFVSVVQDRVEEFLTGCAAQEVLQPTGCPFGYRVQDRIVSPPTWSIAQQPAIRLEPDGANWVIPPTPAVARIAVDIRSLFDGRVESTEEDVPFTLAGSITVDPEGRASISITTSETQ
ncbi:hypothetical protein FBY40_0652 [Microbacterium sp. SLBN-154]|uniref:hypothetical protein n=1 Tax=Microbacterium sp. SLBN-154 TaxID=2768458 RepID=UPI0011537CC7|nr:hypothetical protein [Microbacterium sp. SLBN-154]TQK18166.1 hypothetical protein FBY40_0652 [Microbacterium sp. SLBN-154]